MMPPKRNVKPADDQLCMPSGPFDVTPEASPEPCDGEEMYEEQCEEVSDEDDVSEMETSLSESEDDLENAVSSYASSPDKSFFFGRKVPPVNMAVGIPIEFDPDEEFVL